ncbi:hypothetical protein CR513_04490, partial [Mucuna pruriens]
MRTYRPYRPRFTSIRGNAFSCKLFLSTLRGVAMQCKQGETVGGDKFMKGENLKEYLVRFNSATI